MPSPEWEIRTSSGGLSVEDKRIRGYAVVFDSLSEDLGGFKEVIAPDAVDRTLRKALDVRALVDHDSSKILGRTKAGTLTLRKDGHGLKAEIVPPNTTTARDILESVERGDVTGMSFAFRTIDDHWDWKTDPPTRTLIDMEIREVSVVSFPAYPATDVAVAKRALEAHQQAQAGRSLTFLRKLHRTRMAR